jgi:hypothetical protein
LIGRCLVCETELLPADLIIVDNLETDYLAIERAGELRNGGFARRVLIPVQLSRNGKYPNLVSRRFAEVMCEVAGIESPEIVAVKHEEPYSLNVAKQVVERLRSQSLSSVIVVSPAFRSERTFRIYQEIFAASGTNLYCVPSRQGRNPNNWWKSTHGVQEVVLEFLKLQYYRFWVGGR